MTISLLLFAAREMTLEDQARYSKSLPIRGRVFRRMDDMGSDHVDMSGLVHGGFAPDFSATRIFASVSDNQAGDYGHERRDRIVWSLVTTLSFFDAYLRHDARPWLT